MDELGTMTGLLDASTYPMAVVMAVLGLMTAILTTPPLIWHGRNRNISAAVLVGWVFYLNFQTFLNATIWRSDDIESWFDGRGLCDVEIKLVLASSIGVPAALCCIMRTLANVMDTDRATVMLSAAQKKRRMIVELCVCLLPPLVHVLFQFLNQPYRYGLTSISGCIPIVDINWFSIIFVFVPPLIFMAFAAFDAILILRRLYLYRTTLSRILEQSSSTKSRFMRLYILCFVFLAAVIPVQFYVFSTNIRVDDYSYNWSSVHEHFAEAVYFPSNGTVQYDRYIWLGMGVLVFLFFGLGREAVAMYRKGLTAMGFDKAGVLVRSWWTRCFRPAVRPGASSPSSSAICPLCLEKAKGFSTFGSEATATTGDGRSNALSPATICEATAEQFSRPPASAMAGSKAAGSVASWESQALRSHQLRDGKVTVPE